MMSSFRLNDVTSGVPALDKLHYNFYKALDVVSASSDMEFGARYGAFVYEVECAFREEERWMEEMDPIVMRYHQEQHARVLGALHNTHLRVMNGEIQLGREVTDQLLPQWFALHRSTMDATLAVAMTLSPPAQETNKGPNTAIEENSAP